jgi:hypothetical protein
MQRDDRLWAGALTAAVGLVQAWDSGGFGAGVGIAWLTGLGVLVPAAGLLATQRQEVRMGALAAGFILLTWARIASPVSLNTLHLSLFVPALYVLAVSGMLRRRRQA